MTFLPSSAQAQAQLEAELALLPFETDNWPQILQITGRRSLTRESLFLSKFTSNLQQT
jgi:hypothetical protein